MLGLLQCLIIGISKLLDVRLKEFWCICTVFDQNLKFQTLLCHVRCWLKHWQL